MAPRRQRADSLTAQVAAHQQQAGVFEWPDVVDLPDDEDKARRCLQIADDVFATRAPDDWRDSDPLLIAEFCIVSVDLNEHQSELTNSGYFHEVAGRNGRTVVATNPRVDVVHRLSSRRSKLAGVLALTSISGLGHSRTIGRNAQEHRAANPRLKNAPAADGILSIEGILEGGDDD